MLPNTPWEFLSALMGMENIKYVNPYRKWRSFEANSEIPLYLNSPNGRQLNPLLTFYNVSFGQHLLYFLWYTTHWIHHFTALMFCTRIKYSFSSGSTIRSSFTVWFRPTFPPSIKTPETASTISYLTSGVKLLQDRNLTYLLFTLNSKLAHFSNSFLHLITNLVT